MADVTLEELYKSLEAADLAGDKPAAQKLAELPAEKLKDVIPALEEALAKERDKRAKSAIKKALDAAKSGGK